MPVPQKIKFLVEQASCLLLTACSTKDKISCGTGILPVADGLFHKR
ncbi:hypothetical protein QUB28_09325 [Microcoleus sp. B4-C3]